MSNFKRHLLFIITIIILLHFHSNEKVQANAVSQITIKAVSGNYPIPNAKFAVIVDGKNLRYVESDNFGIVRLMISGQRLVVLGPVLKNNSEVYVPLYVNLSTIEGSMLNLTLNLIPGAIIKVLSIPPVEKDAPIKFFLNIIPETNVWNTSWIQIYGSLSPYKVHLINITGDMAIVPANNKVKIQVTFDDGEISEPLIIDHEGKPFNLGRNEQIIITTLAEAILRRNNNIVREALNEAVRKIREAEKDFYVGLELENLENAKNVLKKSSEALLEKELFSAAYHLKEAYILCRRIVSELDELKEESVASISTLILFVTFTSFGLATLCTEKNKRIIFTLLFLFIIIILLYYIYPGFKYAGIIDYMMSGYVIFLVFLALFLIDKFFGDVKSTGGVLFLPAVFLSFSIAIRNMKRKKFRTSLLLLTIIITVVGITCLTTFSISFLTKEIIVTPLTQNKQTNLIVVSRINGPISYDDLTWIWSQPEIEGLALKAQSSPKQEPLGYIGKFEVHGIIGTTLLDPNLQKISTTIYPKDCLEEALTLSNSALISKKLAEKAGVSIGDNITICGVNFKIAGFFDPKEVEKIKDVDDVDWLPEKINPTGLIYPCSGDEIVILNTYVAVELGAIISRVYIYTSQSIELSKRLSMLSSYFVKAYPRPDIAYFYIPSSAVELKGSFIVIPLVLVILNITVIMITVVYERKREILILSMVGLNPSHITYIFVSEALIVGFTCGNIGYLTSIVTFKILSLLGVYLPINLKVSTVDMMGIVGISVSTTVLSYLVPALKASTLAIPSLLRKWRMEEKPTAGIWSIRMPLRIPHKKVENLIDYLCKKIREETVPPIVIDNINWSIQLSEGYPVYQISFRYLKSDNRPFSLDAKIVIRRENEDYAIFLDCKPLSVYPRFANKYVREVSSYLRKIILEWASLGHKITMPPPKSMDQLFRLIEIYNPQKIYIVCVETKNLQETISGICERLRFQSMPIPSIKVSVIGKKEIQEMIKDVLSVVRDADIICIDSDNGLLSASLTIAGLKEGKRLCYFANGNLIEVSRETLLRLMPAN